MFARMVVSIRLLRVVQLNNVWVEEGKKRFATVYPDGTVHVGAGWHKKLVQGVDYEFAIPDHMPAYLRPKEE